ncbi:hypothetical protein MTR67_050785 [Solanum verrucosum]|uniref:F-box domain-containing protein n=1 Tax=Solanum verrucosum TaxID=315347 RepID=A0AAF0V2N0_SOLVR|nr:hypothetical protein MTR67_050785 [Solanum verrucosum]
MADCTKLSNDVIAHIANRIKVIEDFIAFGAVCTSWRIATTKDNFDVLSSQVPLLMLQGVNHEEYYQNIYSLSKKKASPIFLLQVRGSECVPISEGWLCTMERDTGGDKFVAPFLSQKNTPSVPKKPY